MNMMKRGDYILIIILLLFAGVLFLHNMNNIQEKGTMVEIRFADEDPIYVSIDQNTTLDLSRGDLVNILCIEDEKVYMLESNCRDQLCVRRGEISLEGESIVCLPHRISIVILGTDRRDIDALSQ